MNKINRVLIAILIFSTAQALATEYTGQIIVFKNDKPTLIQVSLPSLNGPILENEFVQFGFKFKGFPLST